MGLTLTHFRVFDHRQIVLIAKLVRNTAHLCPRTVFFLALIMLGFKGSARNKVRVIHDNMCVAMFMVGMNCYNILILLFQQSVA